MGMRMECCCGGSSYWRDACVWSDEGMSLRCTALWQFPERAELWLQPMDDACTRLCQRPSHKAVYIWNVWIIGGTRPCSLSATDRLVCVCAWSGAA